MQHFPTHRATAAVSISALRQNYFSLAALAAKNATGEQSPRIIAVVKANAYGHGVELVVPALLSAGCSFFAVATVEEALTLRALAPVADILILGYTPPHHARELAVGRLLQTVFSGEYAHALSACAKAAEVTVNVHLKIDGGMCRLGFSPEAVEEIAAAATLPHLCAKGIYTHFPSADRDLAGTRAAFLRFLSCKGALAARGLSLFSHAAASAALLTFPEMALDGARVGLALYGIAPTKTTLPLRPAMTLTAPVVQIREVAANTPVGYGGSFITTRKTKIGTLPIGYADGVPRRFGKAVGGVRVLTKKGAFFAPVAGNICMDQMMIDLTDTPIGIGDRAVFFDRITEAATALETIPYELLTGVGSRVLRIRENERNEY